MLTIYSISYDVFFMFLPIMFRFFVSYDVVVLWPVGPDGEVLLELVRGDVVLREEDDNPEGLGQQEAVLAEPAPQAPGLQPHKQSCHTSNVFF